MEKTDVPKDSTHLELGIGILPIVLMDHIPILLLIDLGNYKHEYLLERQDLNRYKLYHLGSIPTYYFSALNPKSTSNSTVRVE